MTRFGSESVARGKLFVLTSKHSNHFKPDFSILESCCVSRYGKGQRRLKPVVAKFWSLEGQEAGNICKESIFWNFLNLFDFIEAMGSY